jgi:hypothetical protein
MSEWIREKKEERKKLEHSGFFFPSFFPKACRLLTIAKPNLLIVVLAISLGF